MFSSNITSTNVTAISSLLTETHTTHIHQTPPTHNLHTTPEVLEAFPSETVVHYGKRSGSLKRQQIMQFENFHIDMLLFLEGLRITSLTGWRPIVTLHHSHLLSGSTYTGL